MVQCSPSAQNITQYFLIVAMIFGFSAAGHPASLILALISVLFSCMLNSTVSVRSGRSAFHCFSDSKNS